jgi:hypothetical protein
LVSILKENQTVLLKLTKQESWEFKRMSVTFYFEKDAEETESFECDCVDNMGRQGPSTCKTCRGKGLISYTRGVHECNFSNSNAFILMANILDIEDWDYAGEIEPELLLKRIIEAKLLGWTKYYSTSDNSMERRINALEELTIAAKDAGDLVRWS